MSKNNFFSLRKVTEFLAIFILIMLLIALFPGYLYAKNLKSKPKIKEEYTKSLYLPLTFSLRSESYAPYTWTCTIAGTCETYWQFTYATKYSLPEITNQMETILRGQGYNVTYSNSNINPKDEIWKDDQENLEVQLLNLKVPSSAQKNDINLEMSVYPCVYDKKIPFFNYKKISTEVPQCLTITANLVDKAKR